MNMFLKSCWLNSVEITHINFRSFAACSITSYRDAFKASSVTVTIVWSRMFSVTVFVIAAKLRNENGYLIKNNWQRYTAWFANENESSILLAIVTYKYLVFSFMTYFSIIPRSTLTVSIVVVTRRKRTSTPFDGMYSLIFISSRSPPTDNSQCCSAPALIPSNEISSKFPLALLPHWNLKMSV